ncbi:hypothetical protein FQN60_017623 [Etheostoma spectabile]|uniref:Uncharacterized protein n=1 Tax=Etheostoma spectabile TaxID=54343 RepID=A0A5J5DFR6_9PERO|nr:hypothetical protein FQN60_017623 [Etheostoma spectabile]
MTYGSRWPIVKDRRVTGMLKDVEDELRGKLRAPAVDRVSSESPRLSWSISSFWHFSIDQVHTPLLTALILYQERDQLGGRGSKACGSGQLTFYQPFIQYQHGTPVTE